MVGGYIAGGLGAALAARALLMVLSAADRPEPIAAGLKFIAAAFVGGQVVLGIVVVILTITMGGDVDVAIGSLTAAMIAIGSYGIAWSYRRFADLPREVGPGDRSGTILRMAIFQGIGVIGIVITLLAVFLSPA